jgi:hypothetical protein
VKGKIAIKLKEFYTNQVKMKSVSACNNTHILSYHRGGRIRGDVYTHTHTHRRDFMRWGRGNKGEGKMKDLCKQTVVTHTIIAKTLG